MKAKPYKFKVGDIITSKTPINYEGDVYDGLLFLITNIGIFDYQLTMLNPKGKLNSLNPHQWYGSDENSILADLTDFEKIMYRG